MKKLYFFLMAMMVAVVANAATVYFQNTANWADIYFYCWGGAGASAGWPGDVVTTTVEKDGVTYYKVTTECPSGIFNNGNGLQTSDLQMVDNMIYNASGSTGVSFEGGSIVVTKNFTLAGNFNGYVGNDADYAFTAEGNDIYTFHLDSLPATGDFAVVENGAVWYKYAATPLESGKTYEMGTAGMDNCTLTGAATDITFEFNASNNTLKVTYTTGGVVVPPVTGDNYYLVGGFNGWALEDAALKFTAQADGTYVLDYNGTLTSEFKINDGTWNDDSNYGSNGSQLVVGELYALGWGEGCGNITMASNVENAHLVFDPTAKTLLITGSTSEAKTAYDLWGDWNGTGAWSAVVLTEEDGKWSASQVEAAATIGFGIRVLDASTGTQTDWISAAGDGVISDSGVFDVTVEGTNFTLAPGVWSMTFDPEAMTLSVVGTTAVAEVEVAEGEAAYYTLQGVKVANPENGIYVKVVDGKASKVVVK